MKQSAFVDFAMFTEDVSRGTEWPRAEWLGRARYGP